MESTILKVNDLSKKYKKRTVVNELSFQGVQGEILGFLGPNGAGKTTTMKMITGLVSISSGDVHICNYSVKNELEKALKCVGAIVEIPYLYEQFTGMDNLKLFAKVKGTEPEEMEKIIELMQLGERINDKVKEYSLGMKQRLGIGVALLGNPPLLILDEPTNGLDPMAIRDLREFLKYLAHEKSVCVLVSSHMLWEMEKLCDRVIIIHQGKLIGNVKVEELSKNQNNLEDYYIDCMQKTKKEQV